MIPVRISQDERRIVEDEIRAVRDAFPDAPRTFPFVAYLGSLVRRFRRKGIDVDRERLADLLLVWARSRNDVRLLVYVPLARDVRARPERMGHVLRVVERNPGFVEWLDLRLAISEGDLETEVPQIG